MIMAAKIACFVGTENEAKLVEELLWMSRMGTLGVRIKLFKCDIYVTC
jgi:hypothetical protein